MCFVTGERTSDSVLDIWAELVNECHHHDINLVLVTMALRGKYEPFKAIEIYQSVIEMLKHTHLAIALVDLNHLSAPDSQVACNMGLGQGINTAYFASQIDAKTWLVKQSASTSKAKMGIPKPPKPKFTNFA